MTPLRKLEVAGRLDPCAQHALCHSCFVVVGALESVQGWGVGAWHLCYSRMLVTQWLLRL